ncbi:polyribonucleotide nucleotidyltransferase [Allohahella marinimesophila]|uniref:Uncharacterized protein n=1 Tax=Allohahella marinimesophila TaxID=1054972 RepID=A0ABP7Q449_9GAMM
MKKLTTFAIATALVTQLAACGTILHPERKGQRGGNIDPAIAVLDGIGLLFFLIPGIIAFAIDFSNGTIYLPGGSAQLSPEEMDALVADNVVDKQEVAKMIAARSGEAIDESAGSSMEIRRM